MCKKIVFSICTLLLGIFIYYLGAIHYLTKTNLITTFIRNYVPDILWTISSYSFSTVFSKNITPKYILLTALYVVTIGLMFELLQFTGIVRGTFDIFDIIVYIVFSITSSLAEKYYWRDKI